MLNSQLVGAYISRLRKERDLTQMDLANSLNVSHQAVSKWERGESLPDLGTLVELATMFEVSVDSILNGGQKEEKELKKDPFIKNIVHGHAKHAAHFMNSGSINMNELVEMAPLMKASALGELTSNVDEDVFSIQHLAQLAPFLTESVLNDLIKKLNPKGLSIRELSCFAPFISRELLLELFNRTELTNLKELIHLAPFLGDELAPMLDNIDIDELEWRDVVVLAPFLEKKSLIDLAKKKSDGMITIHQASSLAPFMGEDMDFLLDHLELDELEIKDLTGLLPFLKKERIIDLMKNVSKGTLTMKHITTIAPFLDEEHLELLLEDQDLVELTPKYIASLAPFLSQKLLVKLVENFSRLNE